MVRVCVTGTHAKFGRGMGGRVTDATTGRGFGYKQAKKQGRSRRGGAYIGASEANENKNAQGEKNQNQPAKSSKAGDGRAHNIVSLFFPLPVPRYLFTWGRPKPPASFFSLSLSSRRRPTPVLVAEKEKKTVLLLGSLVALLTIWYLRGFPFGSGKKTQTARPAGCS